MTGVHKTVTVDLGDQSQALDERMASGRYASPSEVLQEAMQALEREDTLIEERIEAAISEDEPAGEADRQAGERLSPEN
jgi:putative addiction module CopG family antidote